MLKIRNKNVKMWNKQLKAAVIMVGICLLTGSLCACGDDSNAVISLEQLSQTAGQDEAELEQFLQALQGGEPDHGV